MKNRHYFTAKGSSIFLSILFIFLVLSAGAQCDDEALTPTFDGGNSFAGNMFDLENIADGRVVNIEGFDVHLGNHNDGVVISVFYRPGSYVGHESSDDGWTLLGRDTVSGMGQGSPTPVAIGGLEVVPDDTVGLYVTVTNHSATDMHYTDGDITVSDDNIELRLGIGKGAPDFTGETFSPRVWNGTIYYSLCDPTTVIKESSLAGLSLLPNPSSDVVVLQAPAFVKEVIIYALTGEEVTRQSVNSTTATIDVSRLVSGIYFVKVVSGAGEEGVYKMVKE